MTHRGGSPVTREPDPVPPSGDGGINEETFSSTDGETSEALRRQKAADESAGVEVPTLEELQALLLACQTLSELKALKQKSPSQRQRVNEAYKGLDVEQQLKIDGISATAVPHQVFKYTGATIQRDGQKLATGALVFIDPNANVRHCAGYVPVWLMRGLELGWQKAYSVSREFLTLVEKATTAAVEVVGGEQGTLLDSLG